MPLIPIYGEVDITLYFGTLFDTINVPYRTSMIEEQATRIVEYKGQMTWSDKDLTVIRLNVPNCNDLTGCQFVKIHDTQRGNAVLKDFWYEFLGYSPVSKKAVEVGLQFDSLLTFGINNIDKITGVMNRWTVGTDTPFAYTNSQEPISRISDLKYSYTRIIPVDTDDATKNKTHTIVGFPYDMSHKPTVTTVFDAEAGLVAEDYAIPVTKLAKPTTWRVEEEPQEPGSNPTRHDFKDGLRYYVWDDHSDPLTADIQENYSAMVGWKMDVSPVAYTLPPSSRYSITNNEQGEPKGISEFVGTAKDIVTGLPLTEGTYNNAKTGEVGLFYTLYNEYTGDSVTVANEDLKSTVVRLSCNPYVNGCFSARFRGYLDDDNGYSGWVRSCGWQPATIAGRVGAGVTLNDFNLKASQSTFTLSSRQSFETAQLNYRRNRDDIDAGELKNVVGTVGGVALAGATGGLSATVSGGYALNSAGGLFDAERNRQWNYKSFRQQRDHIAETEALQLSLLNARGDINAQTPPAVKFAQNDIYSAHSYDFVIRKTSLSTLDRNRLDQFLTAYGYNVDGMMIADPTYLNARKYFTFIQARDVRVYSHTFIADTLIEGFDTQRDIARRFEVGLRIWQGIPNFDYTINNTPRNNYVGEDEPGDGDDDIIVPDPITPIPEPTNPAERILTLAKYEADQRVVETGLNNVKYNTAYYGHEVNGSAYAWCCVFIWWLFRECGLMNYFNGGSKTASCTTLMNYYRSHGKIINDVHDAQPGDLVFFSWSTPVNPNKANHVGIFTEYHSLTNTIDTIEGNTSKLLFPDEGVYQRNRRVGTIIAIARPWM